MSNKLVLLTKMLSGTPAHVIKGALEAQEIQCFVYDDHPAGLGVGIGIVNARVMVPESDLERAREILKEAGHDLDD